MLPFLASPRRVYPVSIMPRRKHSSKARSQNIHKYFAAQKHVQGDVEMAQTVPPTDLDPELVDFCSRFHVTPAVREYHDDEDESDPHLCVSNQSSDIEEESELKTFSEALKKAQVAALKRVNKNKRGKYSKKSK
ncbi:hypothetical protein F5888DRAFT_1639131 [Russula emetica]|nr:hypothetical protein F5888DRAFT_1639126 [Russula emetica]KAF8488557.1 hypothetical protein F5888DRAFT_1639131 [Russula emetica]